MKHLICFLCVIFLSKTLFSQRKKLITYSDQAKELVKDKGSDSAKVLAIYNWITSNINYDYRALMSGEPYRYQSPNLVFEKRRTTCTGYSNLMIAMLKEVGVQAFELEGYTKDITLGLDSILLYADHSWVAFKVDNQWFACDPTWDSGRIGMLGEIKYEKTKFQLFVDKIRKWKFWRIFWSKSRKESEKNKKTDQKIRLKKVISWRVGYINEPTTDYIFQKPSIFTKDHLSSLPEWQMQSFPISIPEFLDSAYIMGDTIFERDGNFDFNAANNRYFELDENERLIYKANFLFKFNSFNFGDKGNHFFAYLVNNNTSGKKTIDFRDSMLKVCDTINFNLKRAISDINIYNVQKKRMMQKMFQLENISDKNKQKSLTYLLNLLLKVDPLYTKSIIKSKTKDEIKILTLQRKLTYISSCDSLPKKIQDSIFWKKKITSFQNLFDSIKNLQTFEKKVGDSLVSNFYVNLLSTIEFYETTKDQIYNRSLVYEKDVRKNDSLMEKRFLHLSKTVKDSILTFFQPTKSLLLIQKLHNEFKLITQETTFNKSKQNDSILNFLNNQIYKLYREEISVVYDRIADAEIIQKYIQKHIVPILPLFKTALANLANLKKSRQKYLQDYLKMKVNRAIKLYAYDLQKTKAIKANLKQIK